VVEERKTKSEKRVETLVTQLARIRVPLGFACGVAVLYLALPTPTSLAIGGAIAFVGELVRIWAAGHLEKGLEVTQSGPYRFTRHPLYAGSAIVAIGAAVASARISAAALIGSYMAITILAAVRHEEGNMRARFGDGYDAYLESRAARVERAFSLRRALTVNKEYKAVLGLIALVAILAVKVAFRAN
jgi:protein-S-isoprenylcysteine O-methyltransferase Ste14